MSANADAEGLRTEELTAAIREIQARVRSRHPNGAIGGGEIAIPGLMPIVHARDAADAKVAAIGTVNPRAGGLLNSAVQAVKRLVSRALDWHVREQVEFNRAAMACTQAILETFEENNRALSQIVGYVQSEMSKLRSEVATQSDLFRAEAGELKDVRVHWAQWRQGWEEKLNRGEVHMLRTISELNAAFQHRTTLNDHSFRESMRDQHTAFELRLDKVSADIQLRMWEELRNVRAEYERLIHNELRVIRQRAAAGAPAPSSEIQHAQTAAPRLDWLRFADRFRGSEENIRNAQKMYIERFAGASRVLDIGCGRGEFLEAARDAGIDAQGIDLNEEAVRLCQGKGLRAEVADLFSYLAQQPDGSLGGLYCSQVIEHLPPELLPELIRLAAEKLKSGALAAFETPNPECLAIFATHFFLDPTHTRPVPPPLLAFYLEEAGFIEIEVRRLYPAVETIPALQDVPEAFRNSLFGGLDYAVFARKI